MNTVTRPDGPSLPRFVRGGMALAAPLWTMRRLRERYGSAFTVDVPILGKAVVISDPAEVKQLFTTSPEIADNLHLNLGRVLGPNFFFAISGDAPPGTKPRRPRWPGPSSGCAASGGSALAEEVDAGGSDLREATIPGAWLTTMRGMGHDLPRGAWPALVNLIDDHIRAGAGRSADGQES